MVRRLLPVFLVSVLVLPLSGCDIGVNSDGPAAIKREGGSLLVAVCADIHAGRILFEERQPSDGSSWDQFWDGEGNLVVAAGTILSTSEFDPPLLPSEHKADPSMRPGSEIGVLLADRSGRYSISASFTVPQGGLSESTWLHPDGSTTQEACG